MVCKVFYEESIYIHTNTYIHLSQERCFPAPNGKTQQGFNRCVFSETKYMNIIYTYKKGYKNV